MSPAIKHAIAVRVPDGNIPQTQAAPITRKKYFNFLTFDVIAKIIKATAVDAIPMPKLAASPYIDQYLIRVPP